MYCRYLFLLFLGLWAGLAAGGVIPKHTDPDMQSIIEDLQEALQNYSSIIHETSYFKDLPALSCTETAAHLGQVTTVVCRLSTYQRCAETLGSLSPDANALQQAVTLNQDLLQHLKELCQDSAECPAYSTPDTSSSSHFDFVRKSIQCVECWSQQVAALCK